MAKIGRCNLRQTRLLYLWLSEDVFGWWVDPRTTMDSCCVFLLLVMVMDARMFRWNYRRLRSLTSNVHKSLLSIWRINIEKLCYLLSSYIEWFISLGHVITCDAFFIDTDRHFNHCTVTTLRTKHPLHLSCHSTTKLPKSKFCAPRSNILGDIFSIVNQMPRIAYCWGFS